MNRFSVRLILFILALSAVHIAALTPRTARSLRGDPTSVADKAYTQAVANR